ncbi:ABC transporter permease [Serratia sp. CY54717]|uniref:ABC transporter permease n=1 Tax=Serratia sp. CY54717 TaxID=3383637 RepID=UPI003FA0D24B
MYTVTQTDKRNKSIIKRYVDFILRQTALFFLLIILVIAGVVSEEFYQADNLTNILRQSVPLAIVSVGLLYVIITAGIDLSVGSVMALASVTITLLVPEIGLAGALASGILVGIICGGFSGGLVSWLGIPSFVATLAMMTIARGFSFILSGGKPIFVDNDAFNNFGIGSLLGLPNTVWVLLACYVIGWVVLHRTIYGRLVISTGSNETASRFSGIKTKRIIFTVYLISGFTAAVAGALSTSRIGVGSPILGISFELDAIAACVIGGARLSGGRGSIINTLIGVMILGVISNMLNILNISGYNQQVIKGVIIIFAVTLESLKVKYWRKEL